MPLTVYDREVKAGLGRLLAAASNPRPYLTAIGNALVDSTRLRFRESEAPDGSPWAPLSPVTIALRRGNSSQPLLDTGALRNSIAAEVGDDYVEVGTNKAQARMLHYGARKGAFGYHRYRTRNGIFPVPWGDVPARPILGVSEADRAEILDILATTFEADK